MIKGLLGKVMKCGVATGLSVVLYACGGSASSPVLGTPEAEKSDIVITGNQPGITPFISSVQLVGQSVSELNAVIFTIVPQPGSISKAAKVKWSMTALKERGYVNGNSIALPVFGLYANYQNQVTFQLIFNDTSVQPLQLTIGTQAYTDPAGAFLNPTIVKTRTQASGLGFDFFIMKSLLVPPVIVDTDGQVRWVVPGIAQQAVYFNNGQFVRGSGNSADVTLLQFDGTESSLAVNLPQPLLASFHHNIDPGPQGLLAEFNGTDGLGSAVESILAEIAPFSNHPPYQIFDMATILADYMQSHGDDPTAFVRPGIDWFHLNASTYDPRDNSVIVSSRENFLIKLNYSTHEIIWIFGDPTKYWYTFPSLRAKALTLDAGGLYPIGQHGVSITSDGYIMVFNDGMGSVWQPSGQSAGVTRAYSEVSVYSVDAATMTAHEVWNFDYGQTIYSSFCSSSYEAPGKTYLVTYSAATNGSTTRLLGVDSNRNVIFDFQYSQPSACQAAWNAIPIELENLQIN